MNERPTFVRFREKALADSQVSAEYEALTAAFEMKRRMIALRKAAGLTQEQMADLIGTKKSNISRLESLGSSNSPTLSTIEKYANALGYSVKVDFEKRAS